MSDNRWSIVCVAGGLLAGIVLFWLTGQHVIGWLHH